MPGAPFGHVFIARGSGEIESAGVLGDRRCGPPHRGRRPTLTAGPDGAEVLIWTTGAAAV